MDAKEFYHRYAAQMQREALDAPSEDLKASFLHIAHTCERLAEGGHDEDQTAPL